MTSKPKDNNVSDEDEEDYMSDAFLKQCEHNDVRPGLLRRNQDKREMAVYKKQQTNNKSKATKENERIAEMEAALNVPIAESNKGFKMLLKMGYKPGSSIGKEDTEDASGSSGIKEPIKIEIKTGRGGLGQRKRPRLENDSESTSSHGGISPSEFRLRKQTAAKAREIRSDLRKLQFACQNLDENRGLVNPEVKWYWPDAKMPIEAGGHVEEQEDDVGPVINRSVDSSKTTNDESSSESESENEEDLIPDDIKLEQIVAYVRTTYFYCVWCGVKYDNLDDMDVSCPGKDKDDH